MPIVPISTKDANSYCAACYHPHTAWQPIARNYCRLPQCYSFDLDRLRRQVAEIEREHGFKPFKVKKDKAKYRKTYRGIGITYRTGAEDPLYDALRLFGTSGELDIGNSFEVQSIYKPADERRFVSLHERDFSEKNSLYSGYLKEILEKFSSPLTKVRILELLPRGLISSHVDFPYYEQIRVHATLETNADVWWEVDGERFQLPADGHFYWFDTGKCHAVWNDGDTSRVVLSVNLSVFKNRRGEFVRSPAEDLLELFAHGAV